MCDNQDSEEMVWKVGDRALAWVSQKTYAKVTVVKDNRHRFLDFKRYRTVNVFVSDSDEELERRAALRGPDHSDTEDDMDSSISSFDRDGNFEVEFVGVVANKRAVARRLCYLVQTWCTRQRLWVPHGALRPLAGCRPLLGPWHRDYRPNKLSFFIKSPGGHLKRVILNMDPLLPFDVKPEQLKQPAVNSKTDGPPCNAEHERLFREFVLKGKEMFSKRWHKMVERDYRTIHSRDTLDYLMLESSVTGDVFHLVVRDVLTEREMEDYLHLFWLSDLEESAATEDDAGEGSSGGASGQRALWVCAVCGGAGHLRVCPRCPATYHLACRHAWLVTIIHRKNPPKKTPYKEAMLKAAVFTAGGRDSSAPPAPRRAVPARLRDVLPCPACTWEPRPSEQLWYLNVCPLTYRHMLLDAGLAPPMRARKWL